jgi:nicotinamidase-related amidase
LPKKIAVIVSDVVNDFFHPKAAIPFPSCNHIVPPIKMLCDEARKRGIPIVFVGDSLRPDRKSPELEIWIDHCVKGTWGAKFLDILGEPTAYVEKEGFTPMFGKHGEELLEVLRSLNVDALILCGVCTPEIESTAQILSIEPGLKDPERPELGWDIIICNDAVGDCGEERLYDARRDLHLLRGNKGSKLKVTTVWELVSQDFEI